MSEETASARNNTQQAPPSELDRFPVQTLRTVLIANLTRTDLADIATGRLHTAASSRRPWSLWEVLRAVQPYPTTTARTCAEPRRAGARPRGKTTQGW
eukprot:scaffold57876_cov62-Phaeocystis_antarctica.AAC.3